ncbi:uncharacterized protein [Miscanthus floridulus]|uniref:uncharacterized protein n=1 Tax=Miscanthus floridulus TaxID=154761 RepID=UPI003458715B
MSWRWRPGHRQAARHPWEGEEKRTRGPVVACSGAKADTPEAWALGKRAVSPVGSAAVAEQVAVEATPPSPQRTEGASGSAEDRPASMDMDATPLPPPPPLRMRLNFFSRKRPANDLSLAPLKVLKASPDSSTHWVAEAQAAIQHGAASARVDLKESAAQGGVAEVAPTWSGEAVVPFVVEAPGASEAEAMEAPVPTIVETTVSAVGVSASAEATMAEAGAPETAEAEVEMQAAEALVVPLAQGPPLLQESAWEMEVYPISSDDTSRAREVVDAEETDTVEQLALLLGEGSLALVRVQPEPRGWDHPRELETRSLGKLVFLRRERVVWDQLQWQRGLLADAHELLSA